MIINLQPGIENAVSRIVSKEDIATIFGSEHMPVLASSRIIAFMEYVALSSVQGYLPQGYSTVGLNFQFEHKRPVTEGTNIECLSRLTDVSGRRMTFEISVRTISSEIANATHTRAVINESAFERLIGDKK